MAHYALVNARGIVEQVIVAEQDVIDSGLFGSPSSWVQTSYNTHGGVHANGGTPLRKNYAGVGFKYDADLDAFIPPKPFASWLLNEDTCLWDAPVAIPTDGKIYSWDEATTSWVEVVAPEEVMEETVIAVEEAPTEEIVVDYGVDPMVLSSAESTITLDGGNDSITLGTADTTISLDLGTGSDTVTGSATPTI